MQAELHYDLPDDKSEFKLATHSYELWELLDNLDQHLRAKTKYDDTLTEEQADTYDKVRDFLYDNGWGTLKEIVE